MYTILSTGDHSKGGTNRIVKCTYDSMVDLSIEKDRRQQKKVDTSRR